MKYRIHRIIGFIVIGLIHSFFLRDVHAQMRDRISVVLGDERRTESLSAVRKDDVVYGALEEFADILGLRRFYNPRSKKMVLRVGSLPVKVTAMNPFVVIDERVYQMPLPTLDVEGKVYVPLALFLEVTDGLFPAEFDFRQGSETLVLRRFLYNITGVEVEERLNGTLIRFITTRDFTVSDVATSYNHGWLNVTLYGGSLDSVRIASEQRMGIVKKIVPFQFESSAQVSFLLDEDVSDRNVYVDKGEVLVTLRSSKAVDPAWVTSSGVDRKRWLIDTIVIDPGHGGKHPGAVGKTGLMEKVVTLDIARRLKELLKKRLDARVLMTREEDRFVGLKERTQFANSNGGKLFVSIHADANKNRRVRGFSTYVLGVAKTQQALEVAQRENSVIEFEESTEAYEDFQDAAYILNAIAQSSYLKESQELARMVNDSMEKRTKIPDLGVHQAGFYVLIGAAMPSILVETGFLSNAYEERLLKTRSFRQKIAEALCESICRFKEKYEQGIG